MLKYEQKNERERIGKKIAELRKEAGYSQKQLGELSGVGYSHIGRIELGKYAVGIDILSKIAKVFDCCLDLVKIEPIQKEKK